MSDTNKQQKREKKFDEQFDEDTFASAHSDWLPQQIKQFISKELKVQREEFIKMIEGIYYPKMSDKDFDNLPDIKGIWYAGFNEAKKRILTKLKKE